MSNSINRQDLSDYENNLGAWRNLAKSYNAKVGDYNADLNTYNSGAGEYNAQIAAYNSQVNAYNASVAQVPTVVELIPKGGARLSNGNLVSKTPDMVIGQMYGQPSVARPVAPTKPDLVTPDKTAIGTAPKTPDAPTFTLQQTKDINKSDQPLADAERGEKGKFSPFKAEEGLVARAMKGFK